jgi:hypothetical protein
MRWTGRMMLLGLIGLVMLSSAVGCSASRKELYGPDDPLVRIPGMKRAVQTKDLAAVSRLVDDLESRDPAVRLFAIEGLERLTGQRLSYLYYAPEEERAQAVHQWRDWLSRQQGGSAADRPGPPAASQPATQPSPATRPAALIAVL